MYFTLLKLCQHPFLCSNLQLGRKAYNMADAHWSLIKLYSVAMILKKPCLWSVSSSLNRSTRYWKFHSTLFHFNYSVHVLVTKKKVGTFFPLCHPKANIVTRHDCCPVLIEKISQGNIQITRQIRSTVLNFSELLVLNFLNFWSSRIGLVESLKSKLGKKKINLFLFSVNPIILVPLFITFFPSVMFS